MHINSCFVEIDKDYLTRHQQLQHLKTAKKGIINDYLERMNYSIAHLQNKPYTVIEYNI